MQIQNTLTFLACGVSAQVNNSLGYIGLSSSQASAVASLKTPGVATVGRIKAVMNVNSVIAPFFVVDNIDTQERIYQQRVEEPSKIYHGSWGYVHVLKDKLLSSLTPECFTVERFNVLLKINETRKLNPSEFAPDKEDQLRWKQTREEQIGVVLLRYFSPSTDKSKVPLLSPPPVFQIEPERPDIHMLKLMDSSNNSSDGVASLYLELIQQSGLTTKAFA